MNISQMDPKRMIFLLVELHGATEALKNLQLYTPISDFDKITHEMWKTRHFMSIVDCLAELGLDKNAYFTFNEILLENSRN